MNDNISLEEFAERTKKRSEYYRDEYIKAACLKMDPSNGNIIHAKAKGGENEVKTFELMPWGMVTLGIKMTIPKGYAQRCPPELRAENFNYWLNQYREKDLFVRFDSHPDGEERIRAVLSDRYADFPNTDLAIMLRDNSDEKYKLCIKYSETAERLQGELVSQSDKYNRGDNAGAIHVVNSEIGLNKLVLEAMIYWKAEKSGIILREYGGLSEKHLGENKVLGDGFKETIDEIMDNFDKSLDSVNNLKMVRIEDAEDMLDMIITSNKLTQSQSFAIGRASVDIMPKTLYDIVMVFIRASTDHAISVNNREELQVVGGKIMTNAKRYKKWEINPREMEREI